VALGGSGRDGENEREDRTACERLPHAARLQP
jgi:hypothetical protein